MNLAEKLLYAATGCVIAGSIAAYGLFYPHETTIESGGAKGTINFTYQLKEYGSIARGGNEIRLVINEKDSEGRKITKKFYDKNNDGQIERVDLINFIRPYTYTNGLELEIAQADFDYYKSNLLR